MPDELKRYIRLVQPSELSDLLLGSLVLQTESVKQSVDLSEPLARVAQFKADVQSAGGRIGRQERAKFDQQLVESIHRSLPLTRRTAADMRLWQWLTTTVLRDFVLLRWLGEMPSSLEAMAASVNGAGITGRFLGRFTMNGVSRNALARLWWCADSLRSDAGDYSLARVALAKQDLFQAVFERDLGMCAPVARACFLALQDSAESDWRDRMKRLGHYATTISLESLGSAEISSILSDLATPA